VSPNTHIRIARAEAGGVFKAQQKKLTRVHGLSGLGQLLDLAHAVLEVLRGVGVLVFIVVALALLLLGCKMEKTDKEQGQSGQPSPRTPGRQHKNAEEKEKGREGEESGSSTDCGLSVSSYSAASNAM
jgi:type III secretory pathway component EscV